MKIFKNKNIQIGIGVLLIIIVIVGGYFLFVGKSKKVKAPEPVVSEDVVQTLSAEDLGLKLSASPDNKKIKFAIKKIDDIKAISYELRYEADSTKEEQSEGGESRVERGITGDSKIENSKSSYESPWLDLGSCSKNVCHYDAGVTSVDLTLKIVKKDNKSYLAEQKLDL
jgi:hypothetical protein